METSQRYPIRPLLLLVGMMVYLCISPAVQAQFDLDDDRQPELVFIEQREDLQLFWRTISIFSGEVNELGPLGLVEWQPVIGAWSTANEFLPSVLRHTDLGEVRLLVRDNPEELGLGSTRGKTIVMAGRDSNSNNISDVVMVVERGNRLSWRFTFDPFTSMKSFRRILFGQRGEIPFLFRSKGGRESPAVLNRKGITYRSLYSRLKRTIRLPRGTRTAPKTVRTVTGRDSLLFEQNTSEGVLVTVLDGKRKSQRQFQSTGTVLVGDFTGTGQEVFGLFDDSGNLEFEDGSLISFPGGGLPVSGSVYYVVRAKNTLETPLPIIGTSTICLKKNVTEIR